MSPPGRRLVTVLITCAASCALAPAQNRPARLLSAVGEWASPIANLHVEENRARIDYECGTGIIEGAVLPDAQGDFQARGTHFDARGDPRMLAEVGFAAHRAEYHGWSDGRLMRLTVRLPDTGRTLGPLELSRGGAAAQVGRCLVGWWGGAHISLIVGEEAAKVAYDCAAGTIEGPLRPDTAGNFELVGVYVSEQGGPREAGEASGRVRPARYRGWSDGKRMSLTVTLVDTGQEMGRFQLELGRRPGLDRCL